MVGLFINTCSMYIHECSDVNMCKRVVLVVYTRTVLTERLRSKLLDTVRHRFVQICQQNVELLGDLDAY